MLSIGNVYNPATTLPGRKNTSESINRNVTINTNSSLVKKMPNFSGNVSTSTSLIKEMPAFAHYLALALPNVKKLSEMHNVKIKFSVRSILLSNGYEYLYPTMKIKEKGGPLFGLLGSGKKYTLGYDLSFPDDGGKDGIAYHSAPETPSKIVGYVKAGIDNINLIRTLRNS